MTRTKRNKFPTETLTTWITNYNSSYNLQLTWKRTTRILQMAPFFLRWLALRPACRALKEHCGVSVLWEIYAPESLLQAGNVSRPPPGQRRKTHDSQRPHGTHGETWIIHILMTLTSITYLKYDITQVLQYHFFGNYILKTLGLNNRSAPYVHFVYERNTIISCTVINRQQPQDFPHCTLFMISQWCLKTQRIWFQKQDIRIAPFPHLCLPHTAS